MSEIIHATAENFDQQVLQAEGKVLVDFWAEWCGPCRMMSPVLDQLAKEDRPGLRVAKVNVDEEPALAQQYGILSIPALKLFERGQVVAEQVGAVSRQQLLKSLGLE